MKEERYISLLLAKMLLIVIHLQITWRIQKTLSPNGQRKITRTQSEQSAQNALHPVRPTV
jgi:hypothetical protein